MSFVKMRVLIRKCLIMASSKRFPNNFLQIPLLISLNLGMASYVSKSSKQFGNEQKSGFAFARHFAFASIAIHVFIDSLIYIYDVTPNKTLKHEPHSQ